MTLATVPKSPRQRISTRAIFDIVSDWNSCSAGQNCISAVSRKYFTSQRLKGREWLNISGWRGGESRRNNTLGLGEDFFNTSFHLVLESLCRWKSNRYICINGSLNCQFAVIWSGYSYARKLTDQVYLVGNGWERKNDSDFKMWRRLFEVRFMAFICIGASGIGPNTTSHFVMRAIGRSLPVAFKKSNEKEKPFN